MGKFSLCNISGNYRCQSVIRKEDLGGIYRSRAKILDDICEKNDVPKLLVSKLLHAEFDSQGMTNILKFIQNLAKFCLKNGEHMMKLKLSKKN